MKDTFIIIAANMLSIVFALIAFYMIVNDKDYWGWLIVASIICTVYPKSTKE